MVNKFYQIGQVCKTTGLPHSTIRFWEKNFPKLLTPTRSSGGHRYYNAQQVELIQYLKQLLHEEGYTIEGAKKRLIEEKGLWRENQQSKKSERPAENISPELALRIKAELQEILDLLKVSRT